MDEYIGKHRVKMKGVVLHYIPKKAIQLQLIKFIKLPVWLRMEFEDNENGVLIKHTISAGYKGIGSLLDPLFKLHFNNDFRRAMDEHVKTEFPKLRDLLHS